MSRPSRWWRWWRAVLVRIAEWSRRMAETREILMRTPGATPNEQALVPLAGVKDFYARDTDPGAVGAGSVWKDTSGDPIGEWKTRNAANDGWETDARVVVVAAGGDTATSGSSASGSAGSAAIAGATAQTSGAGDASAGPSAIAQGDGFASVAATAQTSGAGDASVYDIADAFGGTAKAGSLAYRQGAMAGITSEVDATSARTGFNGATPIAKPNITGSRGGNAALASLLTQLAALGLITDGTS